MILKSKVWSNFLFIIPVSIALISELYVYGALISLAAIFSTLYHLSGEQKYGLVDKMFACLVIGYNLCLCYWSKFEQPYFTIALFFVIVGLYYLSYRKKDDWQWHLSSTLVTLFCLLGYIMK